jgi:hypothetical protein
LQLSLVLFVDCSQPTIATAVATAVATVFATAVATAVAAITTSVSATTTVAPSLTVVVVIVVVVPVTILFDNSQCLAQVIVFVAGLTVSSTPTVTNTATGGCAPPQPLLWPSMWDLFLLLPLTWSHYGHYCYAKMVYFR